MRFRALFGAGHVKEKEETTYGLSPKQLARLLAMGKRGAHAQNGSAPSPTPAELLQDILSSELPLDPTSPDSLPALLNWPSHKVLAASGQTVGNLLSNPKTDLGILIALKDYGKALARRGGPEAKQVAATALYYAAIASALVFHDRRITQLSYEKLHKAYAEFEQKPWGSPELKHLFREARAICQKRSRTAAGGVREGGDARRQG